MLLSDDMVRIFMNKYAEQAHKQNTDVPKKVHPHIFRHSRVMLV